MNNQCTIQLFADDAWHDVASVLLVGPEEHGCLTQTYTGYAVDWVMAHQGARDAWAVSSQFPVSLEAQASDHWPVALIDMLPQGFGRGELLRQLNLPETLAASADWRLLQAGAGNPIGHLRIEEAAAWLAGHAGPRQGFTDEEVAQRSDGFIDYLATHGLLVAGSSGVQGEWPKLLLTRARDGLLYIDHTLADSDAAEHFIVKFGRGPDARLATILRHEAPYMRIAGHLGLRVHAPLRLRNQALFIPRFDRQVLEGRVLRLAQESLATLTGRAGFGVAPSHDEVCHTLAQVCSNPAGEILEYLRRDLANSRLAIATTTRATPRCNGSSTAAWHWRLYSILRPCICTLTASPDASAGNRTMGVHPTGTAYSMPFALPVNCRARRWWPGSRPWRRACAASTTRARRSASSPRCAAFSHLPSPHRCARWNDCARKRG